jgi:hypothetical protein
LSALLLAVLPSIQADVLKLKDGTSIEGNIVSETETEFVVERVFGSGSITSRDTILKSNVAEAVRATPEEKARQAMEQAYANTRRYNLDAQRSQSKEYYEKVIEGVLRKFLVDHADSPYAKQVAEKIGVWEAERDKVEAGQVKVEGRWMSAEEAKELLALEQSAALVQQARSLMAVQRFADAVQRLDQALALDSVSAAAAAARRSQKDCYLQWYRWLNDEKQRLETEIPVVERQVEELKVKVADAQKRLGGTSGFSKGGSGFAKGGGSGGTTRMGGSVGNAQAAADVAKFQNDLLTLQSRLSQMQAQLRDIKRDLPRVEAKASEAGIQVASAGTTTTGGAAGTGSVTGGAAGGMNSGSNASSDGTEDDLLAGISAWAKKYWMWAVGFLLIVVWFVSKRLGQ